MYKNNIVWELRVSGTDELITTYTGKYMENFNFKELSLDQQKKIKEIVLSIPYFNNFSEEVFDEWDYYIVTVGMNENNDEEDYNSLSDFKREGDFELYPLYLLKTIQREDFNVTADYYTVQKIAGSEDSMVILASYRTFKEAEKYCKKYHISVNNILPQKFGENFLDITQIM